MWLLRSTQKACKTRAPGAALLYSGNGSAAAPEQKCTSPSLPTTSDGNTLVTACVHVSQQVTQQQVLPSSAWSQLATSSTVAPVGPLRSISTSSQAEHPSSSQGAGSLPSYTAGPAALYWEGRRKGMYRPDPRQEVTIKMLQELYERLDEKLSNPAAAAATPDTKAAPSRSRPSGLTMLDSLAMDKGSSSKGKNGGSWWSNMLGSSGSSSSSSSSSSPAAAPAKKPDVIGLYMYGGVGVGKTMLMDIFVNSAKPEFKVLRTHFHDFMLDVHAKLRKFKGEEDPLVKVADLIGQSCTVLALDEFFVTDVADAMILARLFGRLWDRGLVLVATSNRHPDKLYENGLQRYLFLPFIARLKDSCVSHDMASRTDYRRLAQHLRGLFFVSPSREEDLYERFIECVDSGVVGPATVSVMMGRTLEVPLAGDKACKYDFMELCGRPVAAADYLAITERYHTLALSGVPVFVGANRSEAYRFVTLIDVLYEHRIRLLCSADAMPFELFEKIITQSEAAANPELKEREDTIVDDNLGFAKDRTISRLTEMQSLEYQVAHAKLHEPELLLVLEEALKKKGGAAQGGQQH